MRSIALLTLVLFCTAAAAQHNKNDLPKDTLLLNISFLDANEKKLKEASLEVYKDSFLIVKSISEKNGHAQVRLPLQPADYIVVLSKKDLVTKKFWIAIHDLPPWVNTAAVTSTAILREAQPGSDNSFLENILLGKIEYNPDQGVFDFDPVYADSIGKLIEAHKAESVQEKYNAIITKADELYNVKDYANAKKMYTEALMLKPGEHYPKGRIEEISKIPGTHTK